MRTTSSTSGATAPTARQRRCHHKMRCRIGRSRSKRRSGLCSLRLLPLPRCSSPVERCGKQCTVTWVATSRCAAGRARSSTGSSASSIRIRSSKDGCPPRGERTGDRRGGSEEERDRVQRRLVRRRPHDRRGVQPADPTMLGLNHFRLRWALARAFRVHFAAWSCDQRTPTTWICLGTLGWSPARPFRILPSVAVQRSGY